MLKLKRVCVVCLTFAVLMTLGVIIYSNIVQFDRVEIRTSVTGWSIHGEHEYYGENHSQVVEKYFASRKHIKFSGLGKYLFGNGELPKAKPKIFKILVWKDGLFLERRHLRYFTNTAHDPFDRSKCSVSNCILTYKDEDLKDADAVAILLHRMKVKDLPKQSSRPPHQRWVFITDESLRHTFLYGSKDNNYLNYSGIFNWSMTYTMESDVPVPYGRTVALLEERQIPGLIHGTGPAIMNLVPNGQIKRKDVLVAAMISNCGKNNRRIDYIKELQKYLTVHIYGSCGTELKNACPGHFGSDCPLLNKYIFYLAFENTNCDEYFTEKLWWNAYSKGAVPVIMGPKSNSSRLTLPPDSYINVYDFARPVDLARYIIYINQTWDAEFFKYHNWRRHFEVRNEHGYFGATSVHYCRLCEALNYNDEKPKVYEQLSNLLDPQKHCHNTTDWDKDFH